MFTISEMQTPVKLLIMPYSRKRCFDYGSCKRESSKQKEEHDGGLMNAAKAFDFNVGLNTAINGGQWWPPLDNGSNSYSQLYRAALVARKSPPVEGFPAASGIADDNRQPSSQFSEKFSPNPSNKSEGEDSLKKKKIENKPPRKNKYFWPKIDDRSKPQKTPKNASTPKPKAKRGRKPKVSTSPKEDCPISEPRMLSCPSNSSPPCPVTPKIHEPLLRKLEQTPDEEHGCCLTSLRYATYGDRDAGGTASNFGGSCRRALDFGFEDQVKDSYKDESANDIEGVKEDPRKLRAKLWKKKMSFFEGRVFPRRKRSKMEILDSLIKHFKSLSCSVRDEHTCSSSPLRGQSWDCSGENRAHLHPRCKQNGSNISTVDGSQIFYEEQEKDIERALILDNKEKKKIKPKIDLDRETIRVWNLLMMGEEHIPDPEDEKTKAWWKEERRKLRENVEIFITRMRVIQGNRRFSRWNGSVVDSVVGVFLTQNVSDVLSSSAFMSLASKCPIDLNDSKYNDNECGDDDKIGNLNAEDQDQDQNQNHNGWGGDVKDGITNMQQDQDQNQNHNQQQNNDGSPNAQNQNQNQQRKSKNWDELRKKYSTGKARDPNTRDSVDYEAVRRATVKEISEVIKDRGQNVILAIRIKEFLDRMVQEHGSIDLEWLRDVPPHDAKEYLLSIKGIGLKSVECIRLLCLQHHAFPVDTNVARVAVRLGWIPLKPLPENMQFHELKKYPSFNLIQKWLWARLQGIPQDILYELHYHAITAGKVFCQWANPNCNVCPMKGYCKYFASKFASVKLQLPGPLKETKAKAQETYAAGRAPTRNTRTPDVVLLESNNSKPTNYGISNFEPIIELPASPRPVSHDYLERDIEDLCCDNADDEDDEIPTIVLNPEKFRQNLLDALEKNNMARQNSELVKAIVAISPEDASIPLPKFMSLHKLKTVHVVYELDDESPILKGFDKRVPKDPCPYLFKMWTTEFGDSQDNNYKEHNEQIVFGSILIPCRTANRGFFPLNGTYFQPNEVFADYESSRIPIPVHRDWLWNRPMRFLYCGTNVSSIHRGFSSILEVQRCCRYGYYCSRSFKRKTRKPRPLPRRFHLSPKEKANMKGTSKNSKDGVVVDDQV